MKYLVKYVILSLGLFVITLSCQKENLNEQEEDVSLNQENLNNLFKKGKLSIIVI